MAPISMLRSFLLTISLLLALAFMSPAIAQVYKCTDASGKVSYSQSPCPRNSKSATVAPAPAPAAAPAESAKGDPGKAGKAPAGPKTAAELEQEFRKRRAEAEKAEQEQQKKAAEAKDAEENCRAARAQLASLESGQRQMRTDPSGERYFLNESQIESEKQRARRAMEVSCK